MPLETKVPTRKEWQAIKKRHSVPDGIAKVSIGDSLDKFHKSFKPLKPANASANFKDTKQLVKDLGIYVEALGNRQLSFAKIVRSEVADHVIAHLAALDHGIPAYKEYPKKHKAAVQALKGFIAGSLPRADAIDAVGAVAKVCELVALLDKSETWEKRERLVFDLANELRGSRDAAYYRGVAEKCLKAFEDLKP